MLGQVDGVQCHTWEQQSSWEFQTETEAMAHGCYTRRPAMRASPRLCTQGVPATRKCKHGQCLQCAIQKGAYWNPMLPDTEGVTEMNHAAAF